MQLDDSAHSSQPKLGARNLARRIATPMETFEDVRQIRCGDPNTIVRHGQGGPGATRVIAVRAISTSTWLPAGLYLIAFESRFANTRAMRAASQDTHN